LVQSPRRQTPLLFADRPLHHTPRPLFLIAHTLLLRSARAPQGCCATTGDGLYEGLDWLSASLKNRS
jgi:hypothetical protein